MLGAMETKPVHHFDPALPPAEPTQWEAYTAPQYGHLRDPQEPVSLAYQLPLSPGKSLAQVCQAHHDLEAKEGFWSESVRRLGAQFLNQEVGFVANQAFGRQFVDHCRAFRSDRTPEELLEEAGFTFRHRVADATPDRPGSQVFELQDDRRGTFTVFLSDARLWLTHEKRGATSWSNLLTVNLGSVSADNQHWLPLFWSPEVQNPLAAAAAFARPLALAWLAQQRATPVARKPRR